MDETNLEWTAIVAERKIKEAMDSGEFDNLPGKGKPLVFDDDPFTPAELRVAHKIMRNANALPQWLQLEKDIERERAEAQPVKERTLRAITHAKNDQTRERLATRLRSDFKDRLSMVNTMILKYNEVAPAACQKPFPPYRVKIEMATLEEEIASALNPKPGTVRG